MHKDRTSLPTFAWVGLAIASSAIALVSGVQAQTPQGGPKAIEIAGVRLGMPREEALKTLSANQPPIVDDESGGKSSAVQLILPALGADPFVLSTKFRAKPVGNARDEPEDIVQLYFSPPPNAPTILTLSRSTCFFCGSGKGRAHAPSVPNFLDAIAKRFGSPDASFISDRSVDNTPSGDVVRGETRYYAWTRTGELLTEREFKRRVNNDPRICTILPTPIREYFDTPDDGDMRPNFPKLVSFIGTKGIDSCATVARVTWRQDGKGVIDTFAIELSDRAGILSAFTKSRQVLEEKANQERKQELERAQDRAKKNPTKL